MTEMKENNIKMPGPETLPKYGEADRNYVHGVLSAMDGFDADFTENGQDAIILNDYPYDKDNMQGEWFAGYVDGIDASKTGTTDDLEFIVYGEDKDAGKTNGYVDGYNACITDTFIDGKAPEKVPSQDDFNKFMDGYQHGISELEKLNPELSVSMDEIKEAMDSISKENEGVEIDAAGPASEPGIEEAHEAEMEPADVFEPKFGDAEEDIEFDEI